MHTSTLSTLRAFYRDTPFVIFKLTDHKIAPKLVTIREDLTVWHDGGCIINGMKDQMFCHGADLKSVNKFLLEHNIKFEVKKKKRL